MTDMFENDGSFMEKIRAMMKQKKNPPNQKDHKVQDDGDPVECHDAGDSETEDARTFKILSRKRCKNHKKTLEDPAKAAEPVASVAAAYPAAEEKTYSEAKVDRNSSHDHDTDDSETDDANQDFDDNQRTEDPTKQDQISMKSSASDERTTQTENKLQNIPKKTQTKKVDRVKKFPVGSGSREAKAVKKTATLSSKILETELKVLVDNCDMTSTTVKAIRNKLEEKLQQDLKAQRYEIKKIVIVLLQEKMRQEGADRAKCRNNEEEDKSAGEDRENGKDRNVEDEGRGDAEGGGEEDAGGEEKEGSKGKKRKALSTPPTPGEDDYDDDMNETMGSWANRQKKLCSDLQQEIAEGAVDHLDGGLEQPVEDSDSLSKESVDSPDTEMAKKSPAKKATAKPSRQMASGTTRVTGIDQKRSETLTSRPETTRKGTAKSPTSAYVRSDISIRRSPICSVGSGPKTGSALDSLKRLSSPAAKTHRKGISESEKLKASNGKSSTLVGVSWDRQNRKWRADICIDRKTYYLGSSETEKGAALMYDERASEIFRPVNFPKKGQVQALKTPRNRPKRSTQNSSEKSQAVQKALASKKNKTDAKLGEGESSSVMADVDSPLTKRAQRESGFEFEDSDSNEDEVTSSFLEWQEEARIADNNAKVGGNCSTTIGKLKRSHSPRSSNSNDAARRRKSFDQARKKKIGGGQPVQTSKFIGVNWNVRMRKWICRIRDNGKQVFLGQFNDEAEAAMKYDVYARTIGRPLNFSMGGK